MNCLKHVTRISKGAGIKADDKYLKIGTANFGEFVGHRKVC